MQPFLKSIAQAYIHRYDDLSDICFVFPNKRSGTFFKNYLKKGVRKPMLAPEIISITDLTTRLSGRVVDSRIDMLFRLYNIYRKLLAENGSDAKVEFENFRIWGETVLSDFSDVDQYMVDVSAIFSNVRNYKEISSTFLTDEQKKVIRDYFGHEVDEDPSVFWKHLYKDESEQGKGNSESLLRNRFLRLWELLLPLYERFTSEMDVAGLATSGRSYRLAVENVEDDKADDLLKWNKIVFVGFNALSTAEKKLFRTLSRRKSKIEGESDESYCDFLWDGTGPVLNGEESNASSILQSNRNEFPSPDWTTPYLNESEADSLPDVMKVEGAPSNSSQAKLVGMKVGEMAERLGEKLIDEARLAVVLPDESLLLPLLYSLPPNIPEVNLTMGYSLKLTSAYSFLTLLRRLQSRSGRASDEGNAYFHEDLKVFLAHPFTHLLFGTKEISDLKAYMRRYHKYIVSASEILRFIPAAKEVTAALPVDCPTAGVIDYIDNILHTLENKIVDGEDIILRSRLDLAHLEVLRSALRVIRDSADEHGVSMNLRDIFNMVCRLVGSETVNFEGEPLRGLQVMGLLETRSLDFDYLIIPSMNEGFMPRRMRKRTFIPNTLRAGYGMPPANYQENVFAYYFYRLISRSKEVEMIFDATGGNKGRGDVSRYLLQLKYLYCTPDKPLQFTYPRFRLSLAEDNGIEVEKSDAVMATLELYKDFESKHNLSASAIEKYIACPLRFYFETLLKINAEVTSEGAMDASTQGTVVHGVLEDIYLPPELQGKFLDEPVVITKEYLISILNDDARLKRLMRRKVNAVYNKLPEDKLDTPLFGAARMQATRLLINLRKVLEYDIRLAPFYVAGTEITGRCQWEMEDGEKVNVRYVVDRVDIVDCVGGDYTTGKMRIVDYKTGRANVDSDSLDDIFAGETSGMQLVQLMLYAMMMAKDHKIDKPMSLHIYSTRNEVGNIMVTPAINKKPIEDYHELENDYTVCLNNLLKRLFAKEIPFIQTQNTDNCRYCGLKELCNRGL